MPEANGAKIFSSSAVVGWKNSNSFGAGGKQPLVTIYTAHIEGEASCQKQCMVCSHDRGRTWTKYAEGKAMSNPRVISVGEILWDMLPDGAHLGGAPFNVACQLHRLGTKSNFVSRVGNDSLGEKIRETVQQLGIQTDFIQTDDGHPTGVVNIDPSDPLRPQYDIVSPSAWDFIEQTRALIIVAQKADVLIFGSLAQRTEVTHRTIQMLTRKGLYNVFDANLRVPHFSRQIVEESLQAAHLLKLNDDEIVVLEDWFDLSGSVENQILEIAHRFKCRSVCMTRGEKGAVLFHQGEWYDHPGYKIEVANAVGAGDAFLAGLLHRFLHNDSGDKALDFACAIGAYVASKTGATPSLDAEGINQIQGC